MLAADGTPLKVGLAPRAPAQKLRALMLVAPLLLFILVTFVLPIGDMLFRSVENQIVPDTLPKTVDRAGDWDSASSEMPGEAVFAALHDDLVVAVEARPTPGSAPGSTTSSPACRRCCARPAATSRTWSRAMPFREQFLAIDGRGLRCRSGRPSGCAPALHRRLLPERRGPPARPRTAAALKPLARARLPHAVRPHLRRSVDGHNLRLPRCSAIRSPGCSRACRCAPRTCC